MRNERGSIRVVTVCFAVAALVTVSACEPARPVPDPGYVGQIEDWRASRHERLESEDGWLTLVGLYWLEPGENRFGAGDDNHIVLPEGSGPADGGAFFLEAGRVRVRAAKGSGLMYEGQPVTDREIRSDDSGEPEVLRLGSLRLYVIKRGDRFAVRIKDPESPVRKGFEGMDYFSIDPAWRIDARWVDYEPPRKVQIPTVVGTVEEALTPGYAEFELDGESVRLEPVVDGPDADRLFFIFKDGTSGRETYGAGRFLYADAPKSGRVVLDFNKAYNPPCVFTPYATCPLPPKQNWMTARVEAGEKVWGDH